MTKSRRAKKENAIGLSKADYGGKPTTLCKGCGHNSISNQIIQVAFELSIRPHEIIKLSGIGCSSKSPAYFLGMSHGFNSIHGRMPSVGTGALMANHKLKGIGVSGDGDTGSIGFGQFKHSIRRNIRMVYIVENNGIYSLTKAQFSATSDEGADHKFYGKNDFPAVDLCMEAVISGGGFVARSFAGDIKQLRALLKAALSYRGTAFIDIISPCVAFNNDDSSTKSFGYGRKNELPLHELGYVPEEEEIMIDSLEDGELKIVELHDGSHLKLRKTETDYDPTDKTAAIMRLREAEENQEFITGLLYYDNSRPNLAEANDLGDTPLAYLDDQALRPSKESLDKLMASFK